MVGAEKRGLFFGGTVRPEVEPVTEGGLNLRRRRDVGGRGCGKEEEEEEEEEEETAVVAVVAVVAVEVLEAGVPLGTFSLVWLVVAGCLKAKEVLLADKEVRATSDGREKEVVLVVVMEEVVEVIDDEAVASPTLRGVLNFLRRPFGI